jgi:hypothetical protein
LHSFLEFVCGQEHPWRVREDDLVAAKVVIRLGAVIFIGVVGEDPENSMASGLGLRGNNAQFFP